MRSLQELEKVLQLAAAAPSCANFLIGLSQKRLQLALAGRLGYRRWLRSSGYEQPGVRVFLVPLPTLGLLS